MTLLANVDSQVPNIILANLKNCIPPQAEFIAEMNTFPCKKSIMIIQFYSVEEEKPCDHLLRY